jgi:phage terminase small subunit
MADEVASDDLKPIEEWTDKERAIVDQYFELGLNGTKAAIAAGYSKKSARQIASETLSKPYIRAEINRRLSLMAMGKDEVLARLAAEGRGDMRDFIGLSSHALKRHPDGSLIKKYKNNITTTTVTTLDPDGNPVVEKKTEEKVELELYDAQAAKVQIGRHLKLFTDNFDHTTGGEKLGAPQVFLPAVESDDE